MIDTKVLRANFQEVKAKLIPKGEDLSDFDKFEELDEKRRELIGKVEELKGKRNEVSQQVAVLKREKKTLIILLKRCAKWAKKLRSLMKSFVLSKRRSKPSFCLFRTSRTIQCPSGNGR